MPVTRDTLLQLDRDALVRLVRYFGIAGSATSTKRELLDALRAPRVPAGGADVPAARSMTPARGRHPPPELPENANDFETARVRIL